MFLLFNNHHIPIIYPSPSHARQTSHTHPQTGLSPSQLTTLLYQTLAANDMHTASDVHVRLMLTRGLKPTPYQNPNITIGQPTIVIIPEYKQPAVAPLTEGIRLMTVHIRRGGADVQDPSWNSHSKLNCIAACIQVVWVLMCWCVWM